MEKRLSIFASRKKREERKQEDVEISLRQACSEEPPQLSKIQPIVAQHPAALKSKDDDGERPLHLACWKCAPLEVVQFLVQSWPYGVRAKTNRQWLPLHYACFGKCSLEVIQYLISQWPESVQEMDNRNRLALHLACFSGASIQVIQYLVKQWPQSIQQQDNGGSLALHLACDNKAPLVVVTWLVAQWPQSVQIGNNYDSLPLHRACFSLAPDDVVAYLVQQYPQACQCTTKDGDLPLHLSAGSGASLTVVQCVAQQYPAGVSQENNEHKTPLDMAKQPFTFYKPSPQVVSWLEMVSSGKIVLGKNKQESQAVPPTSTSDKHATGHKKQAPTKTKSHGHHHHHQQHHKHHHVPFEKERERILQVVTGKRNKPVAVSSKYPEHLIQNSHDNVLGKGFFGTVYSGNDEVLDQTFAIKSIDRDILANGNKEDIEKIKNDFKKEQRALLHFRHPNIALLYAYALSESSRKGHFLIYQFAEKGSLDQFWNSELGRERLSYFSRRAQIALDVFIGLRFMHVGNIYVKPFFHRDIKSANIVLRTDMTAQLIDSGLATFLQDVRSTTTLMSTGVKGTRGYVCPKYCTGSISYIEACDIFSFGVVLAELWSGSLQNHRSENGGFYFNFFEEYVDEEDDPRNMEDDLDPALGFGVNGELPEYMHDYKDLALACMARSPEKRPSGDEVMNRLEKVWQECKQDADDEASVFVDDDDDERTTIFDESFLESLQSVANLGGSDDSACRLCRTYATEVGFEECPLCLALQKQRLRIASAVSTKLDAKSALAAPADRKYHAMRDENRSLVNLRQDTRDSSLPVLSRLDLRLNNSIPRLFLIVPADLLKNGWKHPKTWLRRKVATKYHLYFICGHTYQAMKPPIKFTASDVWMDKVALAFGESLTLLQIAARKGFEMRMELGGSGTDGLTVGPNELKELLTEVKHILDEGDYFSVLGRILSGTRLSDKDVQALNGETYELLCERAREERGWRAVMVPAHKGGESNILWVSEAVTQDPRNEYDVIIV